LSTVSPPSFGPLSLLRANSSKPCYTTNEQSETTLEEEEEEEEEEEQKGKTTQHMQTNKPVRI
jgi:hypothetical protein